MVQVQRVSLQHAGNSSDFGGVLYPDAGAVENRCVLLVYLRSESRSSVQSGGCHCLVGPMQQRQRYVLHTDSHYYSLDSRSLALFNLLQLLIVGVLIAVFAALAPPSNDNRHSALNCDFQSEGTPAKRSDFPLRDLSRTTIN